MRTLLPSKLVTVLAKETNAAKLTLKKTSGMSSPKHCCLASKITAMVLP